MRKIPYGEINFKTITKENLLYVDKTRFIEKLESAVNLKRVFYLRPGRFGKSVFTSMLTYYYGVEYKDEFQDLFGNLYIGKNPTRNVNKYYVLKFDFSGMDANSNTTLDEMQNNFNVKVLEGIKSFCEKYQLEYLDYNDNKSPMANIGQLFVNFRSRKPNEKIYVMIDEYDNYTNGILKNDGKRFLSIVSGEGFVKAFYARIKEAIGEGTVERFFATGIAPITLDSMTTGFNIATDISRDSEFVDMVGLTENEVQDIIEEVLQDKTEIEKHEIYEEMKAYYNGYRFSRGVETRTFNTTLVMYYLNSYQRKNIKPEKMLDMNVTANFDKMKNLLTLKNNEYSKEILDCLINEKDISDAITDKFNLNMDLKRNDIISMLYYFGYCTIKDVILGDKVSFKIPNYVMAGIYNDYFMYLLKDEGIKIDTTKIEEAIEELALEGKIDKLCKEVENYLSYVGNIEWQRYDEKYVKGYMRAILLMSPIFATYLEYNVKNNCYIDVAAFKHDPGVKYQAIIEVKYIKKGEFKTKSEKQKLIELKRQEALKQIQGYSEDERLPQENMKKFITVFVGEKLEVLEEID